MPGSYLGNAVQRTEDPRHLIGDARYMDDLRFDTPILEVAFVRSTIAHAKVTGLDTSAARQMPGVIDVLTAGDLALAPLTFGMAPPGFGRAPIATDTVRFVGDIVAVVVADTKAHAQDAAEQVAVDYDPLAALTDPEAAAADGAAVVHPDAGTNVCFNLDLGTDPSVFDGAEVIAKARFLNQRVAPITMEVNGTTAAPDPETGGVTVWASCQGVFAVQTMLSGALGLEPEKVHVVCPAVGGGFGAKAADYPEQAIVAALALKLGKPVRHVETRSESFLAMVHGRGQIQDVEIGATKDGTLVGLRVTVLADAGAYPQIGSVLPFLTRQMAPGCYRIPKIQFNAKSVVTNTTPVSAYRGAGRPEAASMIERAMDLLASELGMDPVELRRKNLLEAGAFPLTTITGGQYDSGDYQASLARALELSGYERLRTEQRERRERGDRLQLGIGVCCYVEVTALAGSSEYGFLEVSTDGSVTVHTGTAPHGQGHETAFAQIAADLLGVDIGVVTVKHSDTKILPRGGGTGGSRSLQIGGSAVYRAAEAVVEKGRTLAAHLLEAAPEDVVVHEGGRVGVAGSPASAIGWGELAAAAADGAKLPDGMEAGLLAALDFDQGGSTYPFGCHVAVAEVDTETGHARLVRHIAVDDCGRILNPMLVAGQQHGGIAQGAAQALFEEVVYDEDGNPLTASLATYAMPSAAELPSFECDNTQTPTPMNPLGAKGIGESGTIGSTPAVQNAVIDAVAHLGVRHIDMPLSPERVWRAIAGASPA